MRGMCARAQLVHHTCKYKLEGEALIYGWSVLEELDMNSRYICIGPVNKAINILCCWFEDPWSVCWMSDCKRVLTYPDIRQLRP